MQDRRGPRPFDVATRALIDRDPEAWLRCARLPVDGPVRVVESDVSTVLADVDKILQVDAPRPWLAHIELQSGRDRGLPLRMLQYQVLLRRRHELPVASAVILLRPQADGAELSGLLECADPTGAAAISFRFGVVRVWERPVEEILAGGIGTLPLAPLAQVERSQLPAVIRRIEERFEHETAPDAARDLWTATYILMGLRYHEEEIRHLLRGVARMRESATYQAILDEGRAEGRAEGLHDALLRLGTLRFGEPDPATQAALDALHDPEALEALVGRLLTATDWADLLQSRPR